MYVCTYIRSKRDGICEKAGLIYLFVRARRQKQTGKRMGEKSGLRDGEGILLGCHMFLQKQTTKSGQGQGSGLLPL